MVSLVSLLEVIEASYSVGKPEKPGLVGVCAGDTREKFGTGFRGCWLRRGRLKFIVGSLPELSMVGEGNGEWSAVVLCSSKRKSWLSSAISESSSDSSISLASPARNPCRDLLLMTSGVTVAVFAEYEAGTTGGVVKATMADSSNVRGCKETSTGDEGADADVVIGFEVCGEDSRAPAELGLSGKK